MSLLILFVIKRNCSCSESIQSWHIFIRRMINRLLIIEVSQSIPVRTKFYPTYSARVKFMCRKICLGSSVWILTQQLNYWPCILQVLEKNGDTMMQCVSCFLNSRKPMIPFLEEVLYNTLIEFGILMRLVRLLIICWNETYNTVRVVKYLSDMFPIKSVSNKQILYRHWYSTWL